MTNKGSVLPWGPPSFCFRLFFFVTCLVPLLYFLSMYGWGLYSDRLHIVTGNLTILLWHWPFGPSYSLEGDVCWDRYRIPGCRLVDQRSLYPSADLVVFHHRELMTGQEQLPFHLPRARHQTWVWLSLESPDNNGDLKPFNNVFNWTMSYRRDADFTIPYGKLVPKDRDTGNYSSTQGYIPKNKSPLACWVVSHYNPQQKRSLVYNSLRKSIKVEVYGQLEGRVLAPTNLLPTISRCYFYLAFENSISKDYITEKLWRNAYQAGAVPVVLGPPPDDYIAVAPPNSFVHIDDFPSTTELGNYLSQLILDKERYAGYFAWRRSHQVKLYTDWRERLCSICSQYHILPAQKVYRDLEAWVRWGTQSPLT
ncbi:alpha-(1,3)-fucosyltransferase 7-like [Oncorhynchus kisutch]|uniref:alpha-(1,3)-fucosyltransferase 7-like n=1 Tax=Oncorhynchus kisutch TaxID=8019 RepID=UPI00099F990B|nr:alpha-(1,3)-fucosyltransferase 7-like [Oncorhynchus kisutch]